MYLDRRILMPIIVLLISGVILGCGYRVSHLMMSNQNYPPKPASYEMPVVYNLPDKPHKVIARIFAAPRNPGDASTWRADRVVELLKERAKELGADAVYIKNVTMAPTGTVGMGGFSGEAHAIRWVE